MNTVNKNDVCDDFVKKLNEIQTYVDTSKTVFTGSNIGYIDNIYEHSIILTYKAFEMFLMRIIISCLNHNHSFFEQENNVKFGKHINDDVCEFLLTQGGYFDFKGREGICKVISKTIGKNHNIAKIIKKNDYKDTLMQMCALRNYASHNSKQAKKAAMDSLYLTNRISAPGKCLQQNGRLRKIIDGLIKLAGEIKTSPM